LKSASTAFIKATQIKRDESDSQSLVKKNKMHLLHSKGKITCEPKV